MNKATKINLKAVILAGGESRRMGQNKALLPLADKPLIAHAFSLLSAVFTEVFISGKAMDYAFLAPVYEDVEPNKGPMGGIYSALLSAQEPIFVCACDMPFLNEKLIFSMLQQYKEGYINVFQHKDKIYPTIGIYPYTILPALYQAIQANQLGLCQFLASQKTHYIHDATISSASLLDVNTKGDYFRAVSLL